MSFHDKVLGSKECPLTMRNSIFHSKIIEYENNNKLVLKELLDEKVSKELCGLWQDTLIIKLLEKSIDFNIMCNRLEKLWSLTRGFKIMDVNNGFFTHTYVGSSDLRIIKKGGLN